MDMIKTILCVCGSGIGTSLMMRLNVESVIEELEYKDIVVLHSSIKDAKDIQADLFVIGKDGYNHFKNKEKMIVIRNLLDRDEMYIKLKKALQSQERQFCIID